jgi:hypothetical protein
MTANSVYMMVIGSDVIPIHCSVTLTNPGCRTGSIQPAARTALPTKSGSTSSMIMQVLVAACVRASL